MTLKRRSKAVGRTGKTGRRKAATPKGTVPSKAVHGRRFATTGQNTEIARVTSERDEALGREKAIAEVLRVISSSPGELERVFQALLENAVRICGANFGVLFLREGDGLRRMAMHNPPPTYVEEHRRNPVVRPSAASAHGRLIATKRVVHIADLRVDQAYRDGAPTTVLLVEAAGARSYLGVPMLKDDELIGTIIIYRQEVRPFAEKQIALVQNFATQAVIAIENTRLLNELRQRTDDLSESLQQQTATADVLKAISRSTFELETVLNTLLKSATRLCDGHLSWIFQRDGDILRWAASYGHTPKVHARIRDYFKPLEVPVGRGSVVGRAAFEGAVVHLPDVLADAEYKWSDAQKFGGYRAALGAPLLREGKVVGVLFVAKTVPQPFTDKQVELVKTFADQAVIAIENTRLLNELRQRTDDLIESLQQQTATSEVLKVISSSPGELEPVFEAMLENATRICGAKFGTLFRCDGDVVHLAAQFGTPSALVEVQQKRGPFRPETAGTGVLGRVIRTKAVIHSADSAADPNPGVATTLGGARSIVGVPMFKDDALVGAIVIYRQEVRPFTDKQIELVQNFAAQAVIAIENTRLLNELRQRTDDLAESLEQQTATSEVLRVISGSPGELEPVFSAMLENATRLCEAKFGTLGLREGDAFRTVALHNAPPKYMELRKREPLIRPTAGSGLGRILATKQVVHIPDLRADQAYIDRVPSTTALVETADARSLLVAPMLKDDELVGVIAIYKQEAGPFTDKQIELMKNFAAQAVIAIENTRLLNELRESLQQQTATADVLKVISSSPGDLEPVFSAMLENATRLCEAKFGQMYRCENGLFRLQASHNTPSALIDYQQRRGSYRPNPGSPLDRIWQTRAIVRGDDPAVDANESPSVKLAGARSSIAVPMFKDAELVGAIFIYRQEVRPFSNKQIELVQNFAAQAVIAIENTRLLNELRESLQQQTATADVLKVISRSTFDLQTVLNTLVESAALLCEAQMACIRRPQDGALHFVANYRFPQAFVDLATAEPGTPADRGTITGRVLADFRTVHIPDVLADPEYGFSKGQELAGFRSLLGVPLMRENVPIGVIVLARSQMQPFTDKQIELVSTFADQAVIAIENVRLFEEIQDKSRQLAEASQHKSQFLANMSHELRTPLNAILGYTELIADGVYGEPTEKMFDVLKRVESNGKHLLGLINDVLDLSKIEAGQLKLDLAEYSIQDVAQTVYSALEPLAADKRLAFKCEVAPDLPAAHGDGRRLTQVLLNLVGNAIKFTDAGEVVISASSSKGAFNVSVRDTGPGISAADQAKLFQEFQQANNSITKEKGGTGLGLAISKRIIEMHGGRIWVESHPGKGSTFAFTIPVVAEKQVTSHEQMHSGGRGSGG